MIHNAKLIINILQTECILFNVFFFGMFLSGAVLLLSCGSSIGRFLFLFFITLYHINKYIISKYFHQKLRGKKLFNKTKSNSSNIHQKRQTFCCLKNCCYLYFYQHLKLIQNGDEVDYVDNGSHSRHPRRPGH